MVGQMLVTDPKMRITLEDLQKNPWYNKGYEKEGSTTPIMLIKQRLSKQKSQPAPAVASAPPLIAPQTYVSVCTPMEFLDTVFVVVVVLAVVAVLLFLNHLFIYDRSLPLPVSILTHMISRPGCTQAVS